MIHDMNHQIRMQSPKVHVNCLSRKVNDARTVISRYIN